MAFLEIDPNTPKGQAQLEAIGWAQDQFNIVLQQYFNNQYKILKGLHVEFAMRLDLQMNQKMKVALDELIPLDEKRLEEAIEEVKQTIIFPKKVEEINKPTKKIAEVPIVAGEVISEDEKNK